MLAIIVIIIFIIFNSWMAVKLTEFWNSEIGEDKFGFV